MKSKQSNPNAVGGTEGPTKERNSIEELETLIKQLNIPVKEEGKSSNESWKTIMNNIEQEGKDIGIEQFKERSEQKDSSFDSMIKGKELGEVNNENGKAKKVRIDEWIEESIKMFDVKEKGSKEKEEKDTIRIGKMEVPRVLDKKKTEINEQIHKQRFNDFGSVHSDHQDMEQSMRVEPNKKDLNFSAFESHLSPSAGQSSRVEPNKKDLNFSAFESQIVPKEKSIRSVKKEEHSLNDFGSVHSDHQDMESSMRIEPNKKDLNFSAFESHLSPSAGQSSRVEPNKKDLNFSAFESQIVPKEKSIRSVKKEEHSLNDFGSVHTEQQDLDPSFQNHSPSYPIYLSSFSPLATNSLPQNSDNIPHIIDRELHQANYPISAALPRQHLLPTLTFPSPDQIPDILNLSDIPMASSKSLQVKPSLPLSPLPSDPCIPSKTQTSGLHIDFQHRLNTLMEALPAKFQQAHSVFNTLKQQDQAMHNQLQNLKQMIEACIRSQKNELGNATETSADILKQNKSSSVLSIMLDRLESLSKLINTTVNEKRQQQLTRFYSPLQIGTKIHSEDPLQTFVPERQEKPIHTKPPAVNRFEKYPLFFINEQYGTNQAYRGLFEQPMQQEKKIYSSNYFQITSKYSIFDNYERGKLVRVVLRYTNVGESYLKEINVQLKSKQTLICKPQQLELTHFPPGQSIVQEIYLPRYNDSDYFIELTANIKTETMGKRRIVLPVGRDICKFIEFVQVKDLQNQFSRIAGSQGLELKTKLINFNEKLFQMKKLNPTTSVTAFRLINRSMLYYMKLEKVDRLGYELFLYTDQSQVKLATKLIECLSFLFE